MVVGIAMRPSATEICGGAGGRRDRSGHPEPAVDLVLMGLLPSLTDVFTLGSVVAAPPAYPCCVVVLTDVDRTLYCRPGDAEWVRHRFVEGCGSGQDDGNVAFHNRWMALEKHPVAVLDGKLYALDRNGKVVIMELLFPRNRVTTVEAKGLSPEHWVVLAESNREILHKAGVRRLLHGRIRASMQERTQACCEPAGCPWRGVGDAEHAWGSLSLPQQQGQFSLMRCRRIKMGRWGKLFTPSACPHGRCLCST